jgi:F-type H+-transporting ATPase subunit b
MKRLLILLSVLFALSLPVPAAEKEHPAQEGGAAHGEAVEAGQEATHGEEGHAPKKILGLPEGAWKFVNLVLFAGVLAYFLGGPVRNGLAARGERIRAELTAAKERREKADQFAAQVDDRLKKLEQEVASILERAEQEGERQRSEMIAAAETEAQKILVTARNEVDARVRMARKELTEYAGELATDRARRLVEESMTDADRKRLFVESVEKIGQVQS